MQKTYIEDFLTKKQVKNNGELAQYYVKGHHDPIVSEEVYHAVQRRLDSNRRKKHQSAARDFSSMIICGDCGGYYGSLVHHSNRKYRKNLYKCNNKIKGSNCNTPSVDEKRLKEMFVEAINKLLGNKEEIISNMERLLAIKEETNYDEAIREAAVALDKAEKDYRSLIDRQKVSPVIFEEYEKQIKMSSENYDKAKEEYDRILEESKCRIGDIYLIKLFIKNLKEQKGIVTEYDFGLMKRTVRQITIYQDKRAVFEFMNGSDIAVMI